MHIRIVRYAIKIGYDGSHFSGFAMQPDKKTVEGEILKRLLKTGIIKSRRKSRFQYAARTDKGVSAFGNVIALNAKANPVRVLANMENIWCMGYAVVSENFNPRHSSYKIYRYYLPDKGYNIKEMKRAARLFEGKHDFSSFSRRDARNPVREIYKVDLREGKIIKIDFIAPSFLWNQVRRMVAAIIAVGTGKESMESIKRALHGETINFGIAKASNLVLLDVIYEGLSFKKIFPDEVALRKEIYKDGLDYIMNDSHPWNVWLSSSME